MLPLTNTVAPSAANRAAIANPVFRLEPVINTFLSLKRTMCNSLLRQNRDDRSVGDNQGVVQ